MIFIGKGFGNHLAYNSYSDTGKEIIDVLWTLLTFPSLSLKASLLHSLAVVTLSDSCVLFLWLPDAMDNLSLLKVLVPVTCKRGLGEFA